MKPTIVIENKAYLKIMTWVKRNPEMECSGYGTVAIEPKGVLRVLDAFLLKQENGRVETDITAEAYAKLCAELYGKGVKEYLNFWWHSHQKMSSFMSGTDKDTIRKIGAGGFMAASVFNVKEEIFSAFYSASGLDTPWGKSELYLDNLDTQVMPFVHPEQALWEAEYDSKVTIKEAVQWQTPAYEDWRGYKPVENLIVMDKPIDDEKPLDDWKGLDDWGLSVGEVQHLLAMNWESDHLETLVQHYPIEIDDIVMISSLGGEPKEVIWMLENEYSVSDILMELKAEQLQGYYNVSE